MKKILLFISSGSESMEISPFIDIIGWNNIINKNKIEIKTCSLHDEISLTWNIKIVPEINLKKTKINVKDYDVLVVPGGFGFKNYFEDISTNNFKELVIEFNKLNKLIVGICTGALALGIAGVLENIKATTYLYDNDRYFKQLKDYKAIPIHEDYVKDKNIITVSGPKNAINMAFELIEILSSKEDMERVKFNMGF